MTGCACTTPCGTAITLGPTSATRCPHISTCPNAQSITAEVMQGWLQSSYKATVVGDAAVCGCCINLAETCTGMLTTLDPLSMQTPSCICCHRDGHLLHAVHDVVCPAICNFCKPKQHTVTARLMVLRLYFWRPAASHIPHCAASFDACHSHKERQQNTKHHS